MSKNKSSNNMTLKPCNLFGKRDTIDEASAYFDSVIKSLPKECQFHALTAFAVFWNTLAYKYNLEEKS